MTYLDTTYVSWVGGLYRRDIHERFGYYDPEFRAAGDTEFKMRVLPHIKVGFVARTLGLFLDYPDARASASVRAEVEDQLAWYVHRGAPGAAHLLERASDSDLEEIINWCAGRRKCFGIAPSTDVELGLVAASLLASRAGGGNGTLGLVQLFARLRDDLRAYDFGASDYYGRGARDRFARRWREQSAEFERYRGRAAFAGFNDNAFEQHGWIWPDDS